LGNKHIARIKLLQSHSKTFLNDSLRNFVILCETLWHNQASPFASYHAITQSRTKKSLRYTKAFLNHPLWSFGFFVKLWETNT